jgi:hypothetical protein
MATQSSNAVRVTGISSKLVPRVKGPKPIRPLQKSGNAPQAN